MTKTQSELKALKNSIEQLNALGKDYSSLQKELEHEVFLLLEQKHERIIHCIKENKQLLRNNHFNVNVYEEDDRPFGTYAIQLEGILRQNGFAYLKTEFIAPAFANLGMAKLRYPKEFSGNITWDGKIVLHATKIGRSFFFSRVPEAYTGSIDQNGNFIMILRKSNIDVFSGSSYMKSLLFDPFSKDELKRERFMLNIAEVKQLVAKYIQQELST